MALKLMYITNKPDIALIAEKAGVDYIFIDMECIGKKQRQGGMDTVQCRHTIDDIKVIRSVIKKAHIMVRVNPIHEAGVYDGIHYNSSQEEIEQAIQAGADIIMLPYFKSVEEVSQMIDYIDGRAKVFPLLETPEAVDVIDDILNLPGIDQIHVGINDLSLGMNSGFMFGLLADGTVEKIADKCKEHHIPFGFGGIASLGKGMLPAEYIIGEHYRMGSEFAILSRSFCNCRHMTDLSEIENIFTKGIQQIRTLETELSNRKAAGDETYFQENRKELARRVELIQEQMKVRMEQ